MLLCPEQSRASDVVEVRLVTATARRTARKHLTLRDEALDWNNQTPVLDLGVAGALEHRAGGLFPGQGAEIGVFVEVVVVDGDEGVLVLDEHAVAVLGGGCGGRG